MQIGTLPAVPALERTDLLAAPVLAALTELSGSLEVNDIGVAEIDPALADTAAFCDRYGVDPSESANCVLVAGRRNGVTRMAACMVLATTRADVNGLVRHELEARKASFAPMQAAVDRTGMEYGGITPIGLPADWPVFVDSAVAETYRVIIGSGVRRSKLTLPGGLLASLPSAIVLSGLGVG
jgi:prolyl-tRNA editing enzyme YbaK/EbsC (Cys-tRNA(Pro) deacylase)